MDFVVVDILNDAGGRELLFDRYALRKVPVVAKGDEWVFGQMIDVVAKFVGVKALPKGLSPEQLFEKYRMVFAGAQRYVRQFPADRIDEPVIPNRERVIRTLCFHVFRIGEAFLETWDGADYSEKMADNVPADTMTGEDIARYGASVWKRYESWWAGLDDRTLSRKLKTYYGDTEASKVFERCTWHSAQHCRQLVFVLERMDIQADRPLTPQDLAGLPLPERLFE